MVEQHNLFLSPKISAPWVKSKEKEAGFFLSLSLCNGLKGIERGNKAFYLSQSLFHSLSFSLSFSFTLSLSFVFFLFLSQLQENQSGKLSIFIPFFKNQVYIFPSLTKIFVCISLSFSASFNKTKEVSFQS
jgi:hypothetical protein